MSPDERTCNQIDFFLAQQRYRNAIQFQRQYQVRTAAATTTQLLAE